jgi:hypothetical protein
MLIYPGFDKLLFIWFKPGMHYIADFMKVVWQVLLFKARHSLHETGLVWGAHDQVPELIEFAPSFFCFISRLTGAGAGNISSRESWQTMP